ncbi:splicing factor [Tanacetum coccineum]
MDGLRVVRGLLTLWLIWIGVSTTKQDYITPEEHAFMMDQEALAETLRAMKEKKGRTKAAIREIWRQNEENDKAWEAYANEFSEPDFNQDFEDQIGIALTAEDSLVPAAIPTQHSQVKSKGKEHFTPADVEPSTPAKKKRGRPKKATTEPSLKPSTKAAAKKSKGKELASVEASTTADAKKTRGRPKKSTTEPSYGRIYYKNRGRSERIANQNKPFKFDKYGTGSTPDKAFSLD